MTEASRDARIAGVAALDQPVRRDLYDLIAEREGWLGRDEAAVALGLPRSVAAFHLDKLTDAGLLQARYERPPGRGGPGAGRPAKVYRRATGELSVSLPERHYELAAALLSDAVAAAVKSGSPVDEALTRAAEHVGAEIGAGVRGDCKVHISGRKLRRQTGEALTQLGYEPREQPPDILLANCPFHRIAERHRALICGMNLDLINGIARGMQAEDRILPRLQPEPGMCCVRITTH
ncbi:MAG: helix-turn-helix transcriptional regulator [Sporichthyaceae bacterium]